MRIMRLTPLVLCPNLKPLSAKGCTRAELNGERGQYNVRWNDLWEELVSSSESKI